MTVDVFGNAQLSCYYPRASLAYRSHRPVHFPLTAFGIGSGVFLLNVSLQLTPIAGVDTMVDTRKARALAVSKTSPC
jgi:hypothetical protein